MTVNLLNQPDIDPNSPRADLQKLVDKLDEGEVDLAIHYLSNLLLSSAKPLLPDRRPLRPRDPKLVSRG